MILQIFKDHGFILELIATAFIFTFHLQRRKFFTLRIIFSVYFLITISLITKFYFPDNILFNIIKNSSLFFIMVLLVRFCFDVNFWDSLFFETGAYTVQHIAFKLGYLVRSFVFVHLSDIYGWIIYIIIDIFVYLAVYLIIMKWIKKEEISMKNKNKQILLLAIGLLLFTIFFQNIFDKLVNINNIALLVAATSYDLISCILVLTIQLGILANNKLLIETQILDHLVHAQKDRLEISKNNIEFINLKYHDLKYQLENLSHVLPIEEIDRLNNSLNLYEHYINTGNETLNILIFEKKLLCNKKQIHLNCLIDGEKISFMHSSDIYSLFGNAIDNAITAVESLDAVGKVITVQVKESFGMVSISFENKYNGSIVITNNTIKTTKNDKNLHGFGIKSIQLIVDKYDGYMNLSSKNNLFNLSILLTRK